MIHTYSQAEQSPHSPDNVAGRLVRAGVVATGFFLSSCGVAVVSDNEQQSVSGEAAEALADMSGVLGDPVQGMDSSDEEVATELTEALSVFEVDVVQRTEAIVTTLLENNAPDQKDSAVRTYNTYITQQLIADREVSDAGADLQMFRFIDIDEDDALRDREVRVFRHNDRVIIDLIQWPTSDDTEGQAFRINASTGMSVGSVLAAGDELSEPEYEIDINGLDADPSSSDPIGEMGDVMEEIDSLLKAAQVLADCEDCIVERV